MIKYPEASHKDFLPNKAVHKPNKVFLPYCAYRDFYFR